MKDFILGELKRAVEILGMRPCPPPHFGDDSYDKNTYFVGFLEAQTRQSKIMLEDLIIDIEDAFRDYEEEMEQEGSTDYETL